MAVACCAPALAMATASAWRWNRTTEHQGHWPNSTCSARSFIASGRALAGDLPNRSCHLMLGGSLFDERVLLHRQDRPHFNFLDKRSTVATAALETVTKEVRTGVEFSNSGRFPGADRELSLVGVGVREKTFAFVKVKVYAVGLYVDTSSLADSTLGSWVGKSEKALAGDGAFFRALTEAKVDKALKIVLARDVEGSQFWEALDEALGPRLKGRGGSGQEALRAFGSVFSNRALKRGTVVSITWAQPASLHIAIGSSAQPSFPAAAAPDKIIDSPELLFCLFDVYLGEKSVSPSAKASIAAGFSSMT